MGNKKSTSDLVLHEWFIDLNKNPLIISRFDLAELSELYNYIDGVRSQLSTTIMDMVDKTGYPIEWAMNNYRHHDCNLNRFEYLSKIIKVQFEILNTSEKTLQPTPMPIMKKGFNDEIFEGIDGENLFYFIIKKSKFKHNLKNIGGLFHWMSSHTVCSKVQFAHFWNTLGLPFKLKIYSKQGVAFKNGPITEINDELNALSDLYNSD